MASKSLSGLVATVLVIVSKSTVLVKAVKLIKLLKVAKPLVMMISILISVLSYGWLYGSWWFAGGLVVMLFIHEMGHVIALRREGLPPSPMVFIPFLGAAIFVPEMKTRVTEARIGIGGPLLGTAGALAAFAAWAVLPGEHDILLLVSYVGVILNLFNLIPISPLDGGRVTQVCGTWFKYVGLAFVIGLLAYTREPSFILIVILVLDSFKNLPRWWRPSISMILVITMVTLFLSGYGGQPWVIDLLDTLLALIFTLIYWWFDEREQKDSVNYEDELLITPTIRRRWFTYWALLIVLLIGVLAVQAPLMPKEVLESARMMAQ